MHNAAVDCISDKGAKSWRPSALRRQNRSYGYLQHGIRSRRGILISNCTRGAGRRRGSAGETIHHANTEGFGRTAWSPSGACEGSNGIRRDRSRRTANGELASAIAPLPKLVWGTPDSEV